MALGTNNTTQMKNLGVITKLAAGTLVDNLQFCRTIDKADKNDFNGKNGYKAGDTIQINVPAIYTPGTSLDVTSTIQAVNETRVPLVLDIIQTVATDFDSRELAYNIGVESLYERVVKPGVQGIAQGVESICLNRAVQATYNVVGTAGATAFDTSTILSARARMSNLLAPQKDRSVLLNPDAEAAAVNSRKGFVNDPAKVSKQYIDGSMGMADGFQYYSNALLPLHTNGTATGSHTVTTTVSVQGQATLAITGTGSQIITAGTVFTVAGVNAVHPQTKADLGFLQPFVVTATNTASGGAYTGVAISPAMYTTGSLQNITAFPQSGAVVTLGAGAGYTASASNKQNMAYQKSAFRMVSVPLVMPEAVEMAKQETYEGVTVAIVQAFDVRTRAMILRIDFLGGFCAPRPQWAARITS